MSVLIAVPTYETIATEVYKALWDIDDCGHEVMFEAVKGYDCALARIKACELARDYGADWLWMVDSDTVPQPDALANMLEHGADVVLGYYQWKCKDLGWTCLWRKGAWQEVYRAAELHAMAARGQVLVEVQGGGLGCALVRTSVLDRLPYPWFRWVVREDGTETGEDVFFCELCQSAGVPVFADTRAACGHAYRTLHSI